MTLFVSQNLHYNKYPISMLFTKDTNMINFSDIRKLDESELESINESASGIIKATKDNAVIISRLVNFGDLGRAIEKEMRGVDVVLDSYWVVGAKVAALQTVAVMATVYSYEDEEGETYMVAQCDYNPRTNKFSNFEQMDEGGFPSESKAKAFVKKRAMSI